MLVIPVIIAIIIKIPTKKNIDTIIPTIMLDEALLGGGTLFTLGTYVILRGSSGCALSRFSGGRNVNLTARLIN